MINPETMEYLLRRQIALIEDQHAFEAMQAQHDTSQESILYSAEELTRLVHETKARRAELALLITCNTVRDEHREMTARDDDGSDLTQQEKNEINASL